MNIPRRASRHHAMRRSRSALVSDFIYGVASARTRVECINPPPAMRRAATDKDRNRFMETSRAIHACCATSYDLPTVENLNTVVVSYTAPGRRTVDGKLGLFGESGKCCVS